MNTKLYIPKKIRVGYVERSDTYTGKLAYVIYWDDKGKLRKEASWESWRDKKIAPQEFDNVPTSGFVLHKDVKRYNWDHFSSKRTLIRVYDPRGTEFEITTDNLIGVLMNTDCSKRALVGEFVYAWHGTDLILLPTCCEEYTSSVKYTGLQAKKISARTLVPGCSYKTKQGGDVVYVGYYYWYAIKNWYSENSGDRLGKKYHIFTKDNGNSFITKSSTEFLAELNSDEVVNNYALIIEKFQKNIHSSKIVKFEFEPCVVDGKPSKLYPGNTHYEENYLDRSNYFIVKGDIVEEHNMRKCRMAIYAKAPGQTYDAVTYSVEPYFYTTNYQRFDIKTQKPVRETDRYNYGVRGIGRDASYGHRYQREDDCYNLEKINTVGFQKLFAVLDNGKRTEITDLSDL